MFYGTVVFSVVAVSLLPLGNYLGWFHPPLPPVQETPSKRPDTPGKVPEAPGKPADLALSSSGLEGEGSARHVAGVVRNDSKRPQENVELVFTLRDKNGQLLGQATASVASVPPGGSAKFQSGPVPADTTYARLREISGTPR